MTNQNNVCELSFVMRNLKLQFCNQIESGISNVKFMLTDGRRDADEKLYFITNDTVYVTNEKLQNVQELAFVPGIVSADYLAMCDEVSLATEDGRVLSIAPQTGTLTENSFCDVGIHCQSWSPEQEVVVFVTKTHNVVVMTCTYDPISEHALLEQCDKEQQFVNVGWGRKETQFHGSAGKSAAKKKSDFEQPQDVETMSTDIGITWRQDGAYFAVSFVSEQYGRMFKVFDKEGCLQFTSEKLNGLQAPIAWRPSGNWVAVPQALPNKSTIALFEKNGLRHREIVLPFNFDMECIKELKWSSDSDILAIVTECLAGQKTQHIYLYTIGNYHWYLKQQLCFEATDAIGAFGFDSYGGSEKSMHVMLQNGKCLKFSWCFNVDKFESEGIVGVIDGSKLLLTNFSKSIVPPPMSSAQLEVDASINACSFLADSQSDELKLCLYDAQRRLHLYKTQLSAPSKFTAEYILAPTDNVDLKTHLANIIYCSHEKLIATTSLNNQTHILIMLLNHVEKVYDVETALELDGIINAAYYDLNKNQLLLHTLDGFINTLELNAAPKLARKQLDLQQPASSLLAYDIQGAEGVISLNERSLFIDDQHIADYVTSICLEGGVGPYLAYTKQTTLHLVRLGNRTIAAERNIESGAKLVVICANSSRAILQMPRGNLEAIYPRLLLLDQVGKLLDAQQYEKVMDILVKQRINLNIICDHDMNAFVENMEKFVKQISNTNWLNLFLSELRNEDVTLTMYSDNYALSTDRPVYPADFQLTQKIKYICEKMCACMENMEKPAQFMLPIITAKVKMGELEAALLVVWQLRKLETNNERAQSEEALKYLLYLVDVNELYEVALGTYDFALVLFVTQKSHKDPREFIPFLNELKELDLEYRKFKIDEHLKRYEKALANIAQCAENDDAGVDGEMRFEEALAFIVRHELYRQALVCYAGKKHDYYQRVCLAYGDYLRTKGNFDNASLLYERGGDISQALRCVKHVLDWQRALTLAGKTDVNNVAEVAISMVPALQEKQMHEDAYTILNKYGQDFPTALECLIKGHLYLKAIYEARLWQLQGKDNVDLVANLIAPSLKNYAQLLATNLMDSRHTFVSYKERLLSIRLEQEKQKQTLANGWTGDDGFDECDLLSDTTSMRSSHYTASSRGTGKTFRSSKNRRKHERKHFSLKPGNPFEDIALIDALYGHVMKIVEQQEHISATCKALLELRQDTVAAEIQLSYKTLLTLIQDSLNAIWTPELALSCQQTTTTTANANIDYTLFQNEQRFALLDPTKRYKPQFKIKDWEHAILT